MTSDLQVILEHFPAITPVQKKQFSDLAPLYHEWNEKINVISRKDIEQLYTRHVLHSLAIAKFIDFPKDTNILDIGTGGGFPGIPLAIMFPNSRFFLADSIAKKIKVVEEVASGIGLQNVHAEHVRAEKIRQKFDFIVSRAVAKTKMLYQWSNKLINVNDHATLSNGYILLKGGDLHEELRELGKPHSIKDISEYFPDPFFETKKVIYIPM